MANRTEALDVEPFDITDAMISQGSDVDDDIAESRRCSGSESVVVIEDEFAVCPKCGWEWGHLHTEKMNARLPIHRPYPK